MSSNARNVNEHSLPYRNPNATDKHTQNQGFGRAGVLQEPHSHVASSFAIQSQFKRSQKNAAQASAVTDGSAAVPSDVAFPRTPSSQFHTDERRTHQPASTVDLDARRAATLAGFQLLIPTERYDDKLQRTVLWSP